MFFKLGHFKRFAIPLISPLHGKVSFNFPFMPYFLKFSMYSNLCFWPDLFRIEINTYIFDYLSHFIAGLNSVRVETEYEDGFVYSELKNILFMHPFIDSSIC